MSVTCTPKEGEEGSVRRLGGGYGAQMFTLTATGGSTTYTLPTIFTELEAVNFMVRSPAGGVGRWAPNATDKSSADLAFTADLVADIEVRGRGM